MSVKVTSITFYDEEQFLTENKEQLFAVFKTFSTKTEAEIFDIKTRGRFYVNKTEDGYCDLLGEFQLTPNLLTLFAEDKSTQVYHRPSDPYAFLRIKASGKQVPYKYFFSAITSFVKEVIDEQTQEIEELKQ